MQRKTFITVISLPMIILALGWLLISTAKPATYTTPEALSGVVPTSPMATPTYSLPLCENEDGSGQMLCVWDAQWSGDGQGDDVLAGDCSTDTVGTDELSALCVRAYPISASMVEDCLTTQWEIETGEAEGMRDWTMRECLSTILG